MVRVSARQAIVVDKYLKLALAQGWAVEVRQIINGGTCGVHRRLIDKVYLTEKCRIAGGRVVEGREIAEEGHP
jgi:predicted chitinase